MNLIKKIFLSIAAITSFTGACQAMEKPQIKYSNPTETYSPEDFKINAKIGETEIGYIAYILKKRFAEILRFEVNKNYRNNTKERVGQHLFQACINDAIAHGCNHVKWTANPTSNLKIDTICIIYERMVQKLENADSYRFIKGEEYGIYNPKVNMKLMLKNK